MNALKSLRARCLPVAVPLFALTTAAAEETGLGGWDWGAAIYFWGPDLGGKTTSGNDIDMPIDDIVDNLNLGVMAAVAATKGDWLLFADAFYLDLGDSDRVNASIGSIDVDVRGSYDLKGVYSTFGGGYRILQTSRTDLHAIGGMRFLWLDGKVEVDATESISGSPIDGQRITENAAGNNWDAVIGLRGVTELNEKWYVSYYGDIGTGDSNLTWQAEASINYRLKKADIVLGYRHLDFDLDNFGPVDDLNLGGPFLGVKFTF